MLAVFPDLQSPSHRASAHRPAMLQESPLPLAGTGGDALSIHTRQTSGAHLAHVRCRAGSAGRHVEPLARAVLTCEAAALASDDRVATAPAPDRRRRADAESSPPGKRSANQTRSAPLARRVCARLPEIKVQPLADTLFARQPGRTRRSAVSARRTERRRVSGALPDRYRDQGGGKRSGMEGLAHACRRASHWKSSGRQAEILYAPGGTIYSATSLGTVACLGSSSARAQKLAGPKVLGTVLSEFCLTALCSAVADTR
jgi:hypothetical protein